MLAQISSESPVGNLFLLPETALSILARNMGTRNDTRPRDTSQEVYRTEGKFTSDLNIAARVSLAMPHLELRSRRLCCSYPGILAYSWFRTHLVELHNFIFNGDIFLKCLLGPFIRYIEAMHVDFPLVSLLRSRSLKKWNEVSLHKSFWNRCLGISYSFIYMQLMAKKVWFSKHDI